MPVRIYRSTNTGAPTLSGSAGSLISVLDVLVNGLPTMAVTSITRSGAIVTVTTTAAHGLTSTQLVTIAGAVETAYNGEFTVTVTGTAGFTYTIAGTPTSPATGTITAQVIGSGWTKPFIGTNLAMYRQPTGTNNFFMRLDDTGTTTGRIRGFETASDVTGGIGPFPTDAQLSGGGFVFKSSVADVSARAWVLVCNGPTFYLWNNQGNIAGAATTGQMVSFGQFTSYKAGDTFNTLINTNIAATLSDTVAITAIAVATASAGLWLTRSHTQLGSSVTGGRHIDVTKSASATIIGSNGIGYPSPVDGGLYVSPVFVSESALSVVRGVVSGLWAPCHNRPLALGDTFVGTGTVVGKSFEAFQINASGQVFLEMSNTW